MMFVCAGEALLRRLALTLDSLFRKSSTAKVKSRLSNFVDVHDPHTLEINTSFELAKDAIRAETEVALFFPRNLKISEMSKASLMGDFQIRMRLSSQGREKKIRAATEEVLLGMEQMATLLVTSPFTTEQDQQFQKLCRRFGILLGDWLGNHQTSSRKKLASFIDHPGDDNLLQMIRSSSRGLENFDHFILRMRDLSERTESTTVQTVQLLNHYISQKYLLYLESFTVTLAESRRIHPQPQPLVQQTVSDFENKINSIKYREAHDPRSPVLSDKFINNKRVLEEKMISLGYLKKFFQSEAFVEVKERAQREAVVEIISIVAAGIAGLIAGLATLVLSNSSSGTSPILQVAAPGATLVAILALIYIFRDRLKDQTKRYLQKRMQYYLPDFQSELRLKGQLLGQVKSWLQINPERGFAAEFTSLRKDASAIEAEKFVAEDIIFFRRMFHLDAMKNRKKDPRQSLHDIMRFNFHRVLRFMDSPLKPLSLLKEDGTVQKTFVSRNYYVYLVIETRILSETGETMVVESKKVFRIVINKEGIQRLELVKKSKQKNTPNLTSAKSFWTLGSKVTPVIQSLRLF
jgi:hypothetical protein